MQLWQSALTLNSLAAAGYNHNLDPTPVDMALGSAPWQAFKQGTPWNLAIDSEPGDVAMIYARYKDDGGNESSGADLAGIIYQPDNLKEAVYLPMIVRP